MLLPLNWSFELSYYLINSSLLFPSPPSLLSSLIYFLLLHSSLLFSHFLIFSSPPFPNILILLSSSFLVQAPYANLHSLLSFLFSSIINLLSPHFKNTFPNARTDLTYFFLLSLSSPGPVTEEEALFDTTFPPSFILEGGTLTLSCHFTFPLLPFQQDVAWFRDGTNHLMQFVLNFRKKHTNTLTMFVKV